MVARLVNLLQHALAYLSTVAILGCLGGLLYWGHHHHWQIPRFAELWPNHDQTAHESTVTNPNLDAGELSTLHVAGKARGNRSPSQLVRFRTLEAIEKVGLETAVVQERALSHHITANGAVDYDQYRVAQLSVPVPGRVWRVCRFTGEEVKEGDVLAIVEAAEVGKAKAEFLQALVHRQLKAGIRARMQPDFLSARTIQEAEAALRDANIRQFNAEQALINLGLPIRAEEVADLSEKDLVRHVQFLGLPAEITRSLDPRKTTANLLPLRSPFAGTITESAIVRGELVSVSPPMFTIADTSRMWVQLEVQQEDADLLELDQKVTFTPDSSSRVPASGKIDWISTAADPKTRTVRVRASVNNPGLGGHFGRGLRPPQSAPLLRANTFGTGQVLIRDAPRALVVPTEALQRDGDESVVFVCLEPQLFEARSVEPGLTSGECTEIRAGLQQGEKVVTTGSHLLHSEIVRRRLSQQP